MSIPSTELNIRHIIDFTLKTIYSNPDKYLPQIFGDLRLPPHEGLYGTRTIDAAKKWINTTKINTLLGFDLSELVLPAITVNIQSSVPSQTFLGDYGGINETQLLDYEREIVLPAFQLKSADFNADRSKILITLKEDMANPELVLPGLNLRDKQGNSFLIEFDDAAMSLAITPIDTPLAQADLSSAVEVISPLTTAGFTQGVMQFEETINIDIHTHQHRNELYFLHSMIMWGLLKFRPLMIEQFGFDLSLPVATDLQMDSQYLGNAVWVRRISLRSKVIYSWEGNKTQDLIGFLLYIHPGHITT